MSNNPTNRIVILGDTGAPLILGALGSLECVLHQRFTSAGGRVGDLSAGVSADSLRELT
jgi:hypothetical protein